MDDWMKTCRWCHWFQSGECQRGIMDQEVEVTIDYIVEEGYLSESIQESFSDKVFHDLEAALKSSSLSKKKVSEIKKIFYEELETMKQSWVEDIEESVQRTINNHLERTEGNFIPKDAGEFCCKYWA